MGVDFTGRRILGTSDEADLKKLPQGVQDALEDDNEVFDGAWEGLRVYHTYYTDKPEFVALGFHIQDIEFNPIEEEPVPTDKEKLFTDVGIQPKVLGFVEQW